MIKANFNSYNNYITDSLYQWDINQDLIIYGLNLSVAPEIHFANANMDRAIVRQSTLANGVITVRIPNSLLQEPLTIKVHVGLYEDDTFKVVELIEIPIIPKARPVDYAITDSDEEIYSFKELENKINNLAIKGISDDQIMSVIKKYMAENEVSTAKIGEVTLIATEWVGSASPYSQVVNIYGVTKNSQVDLTPSVEQLAVFYEKDLTFVTENESGVVTVYAIGQKPQNDYTIQCTITEVM